MTEGANTFTHQHSLTPTVAAFLAQGTHASAPRQGQDLRGLGNLNPNAMNPVKAAGARRNGRLPTVVSGAR